jgi:hypothetical protein
MLTEFVFILFMDSQALKTVATGIYSTTNRFINLSSDPGVVDEEARWYPLQDNPLLQASLSGHGSGT